MPIHTSSIKIKAPTQRVFEALTNPELVKLWQFGRELITDWKPGSEILFRTKWEGKVLEQWGTVLELRPNELVKYNLFTPSPNLEDKPEFYSVTSYVLTNDNDQTKVEIIQVDNRPSGFVGITLKPILVA